MQGQDGQVDREGRSGQNIDSVREDYEKRLAALGQEQGELKGRDDRLSTARGITFLLAGGGVLVGIFRPTLPIWAAAGVATLLFIIFVVRHAMVSTRQFDVERRTELLQHALARLAGTYRAPKGQEHRRGGAFVVPKHPYAGDLDLFGSGSLFEQLDTTQTAGGAAMLARWLLEPAAAEEVATRQSAAAELANCGQLREDLALIGMRAGKMHQDASALMVWAQRSSELGERRGLIVASCALLLLLQLGLCTATYVLAMSMVTKTWMAVVVLQALVMLVLRNKIEPVVGEVAAKQSPLGRLHELMAMLEAQHFEDPRLVELGQGLAAKGQTSASELMRELDNLVGYAAVRHNGIVHFLANIFLLWDVWCAWRLDLWRQKHGRQVARWLAAASELEALMAIGTFAHEHPGFAWPQLEVSSEPHFVAQDLGHPLIASGKRVDNDVRLEGAVRGLMVTGSNMSGKSTMLRSIGVAAVLAQAGAPVCARKLRMSQLRVESSMRVDDSLDEGASRFFAEVRRLKGVVDSLDELGESSEQTVLFLLDEVLHGTNSRERNIGAKAVVQHMIASGALGVVSSHDLGLVELEKLSEGRVINCHFEDHIVEGKMAFDYRMKPGPVGSSNALRLMRAVGIDVPGLVDSERGAASTKPA